MGSGYITGSAYRLSVAVTINYCGCGERIISYTATSHTSTILNNISNSTIMTNLPISAYSAVSTTCHTLSSTCRNNPISARRAGVGALSVHKI